jgi:hypothetical protein
VAVDLSKVKVKAAVVSLGDYVTAKGAGTLVDVGLTKGGVTIGYKPTYYPIEGDQHLGELAGIPTKREVELKFTMTQTEAEKLRLITEQPAANFTGAPPNITGNVDANAVEQYHQVKLSIAGGGVGTLGLREMTFWRCVFVACDPIPYKKDGEQLYAVTVRVYQEITGTGTDSFYRQVDT